MSIFPSRLSVVVSTLALWGLMLQITSAQNRPAASTAKDPVEAANLEFALSDAELDALKGQTFDILLKTGKKETGVTLQDFLRSKQLRDRFRSMEFTLADQKKSRKIPSELIFQLEFEDKVYLVAYLPTQKYHVLVDVAQRDASIATRLEDEGYAVWEKISTEDQTKYVAEEKVFVDKVKAHFSKLPMQLVETQYFLVLSDMPPAQLNPYLKQLDQMSELLGQAFGYQPGHNIWRGKAVVVAFIAQESFLEFEEALMENPLDPDMYQGYCHWFEDGRVVVGICRGNSPEHLGTLMVHETSHGYLHRYKSSVVIPNWLNEGVADWISAIVVPASKSVQNVQRAAVQRLQQTGTLGEDFFSADNIELWQYGVASGMVQMLVKANPAQFQLFFNGGVAQTLL